MKETIAELRVRAYVPSDWIAATFCHLSFTGEGSWELNSKWHRIEYEDYDKKTKEVEGITSEIKSVGNKINEWEEIHPIKKFFKEHPYHEELRILYDKKQKAEQGRFKSVYTLEREAKEFLNENGFELLTRNSNAHECETVTYVYKKSNF